MEFFFLNKCFALSQLQKRCNKNEVTPRYEHILDMNIWMDRILKIIKQICLYNTQPNINHAHIRPHNSIKYVNCDLIIFSA